MILMIDALGYKKYTIIDLELHNARWSQPSYIKRSLLKTNVVLCFLIFILGLLHIIELLLEASDIFKPTPIIVIVTPTYQRPTRMGDLTRMANTIMHLEHIHWILVEDSDEIDLDVQDLLHRSRIPFTYLANKTIPIYPKKGWYQRNIALNYIRENVNTLIGRRGSGVLYFGDDDNTYDIRLFDDFIRKVKRIGMWAVGLVGGSIVESPRIVRGKVVGFNVGWYPERKFAVDMAGFAINLNEILRSKTVFPENCRGEQHSGEDCFLEDMGFKRTDIEPFEYDSREMLVWHTQSKPPVYTNGKPMTFDEITDIVRYDKYIIL